MSYFRSINSNYNRPSFFGGFQYFPPVIKALLVGNVAVFLFTSFFGMFRISSLPLGAIINGVFPLYPLGDGFQVWQLFTYMFMHAGLMHLLFNMIALWMFGMELENVWGSKKFLIYYLTCGLGAGLSNLLIAPLFAAAGPTVGASGAIYGVLIAFGLIFPDRPIFIYFLLPIKARYFVMFYIFLEVYDGVTGTSDGIAHFAHLGGAAVGFVFLLIDQKKMPFGTLWLHTRDRLSPTERVNRYTYQNVSNAKYHDVDDPEERVNQQQIDEILDKISQSGYPSLTDAEKKMLFDASKRLN